MRVRDGALVLFILSVCGGIGLGVRACAKKQVELEDNYNTWRNGPCENFRQEKLENVPARCHAYYVTPSEFSK